MKTAVVILPTYNEKENIGRLIDDVELEFKKIKHYRMKILVVDDNSPDGTQEIVRKQINKYPNISLLTGTKAGLGTAYIRGMDYAIDKLNADVVFEMDADFQHNPNQLPLFLKKIDQGFDIVVGARYIKGGSVPKNWGLHRKVFSRVGNLLVRTILVRFDQHEWTNGFRAIQATTYKAVRDKLLEYTGYTFQVAFLHQAILLNKKVGEIPNKFDERRFGRSKIGGEYVKNLLLYLLHQTMTNPPRFLKFLVVGGIGFVIQFIAFRIFRSLDLRPSVATAISAELAILSNFTFNNLWTFSERKISRLSNLVYKFIQFNLTSMGSLLIQAGVSEIGTRLLGIKPLTAILGFTLNSDDIYLMVGILIGLVWNYTMYNLVIWRKSK